MHSHVHPIPFAIFCWFEASSRSLPLSRGGDYTRTGTPRSGIMVATLESLCHTRQQAFGGGEVNIPAFAPQCPDTLDPRDTCVLNPLREPFAKKECGILLSEVFETCHPVVSEPFPQSLLNPFPLSQGPFWSQTPMS